MTDPQPTLAQQLALWADQLREISASGLRFSEDDIYNRERYETLQDIAVEMFALATNTPIDTFTPLRNTVLSRPTPFSVGDAAIINHRGEILLIQRADNHKWAMPGGGLMVGETPAQGVVREALEETGVASKPVKLVGVYDSRYCGSITAHHLFQFVFLCEPLAPTDPPAPPSHAHEVLGSAWFAEDNLPADLDPGHATRIPDAFRAWHGQESAFFDRL